MDTFDFNSTHRELIESSNLDRRETTDVIISKSRGGFIGIDFCSEDDEYTNDHISILRRLGRRILKVFRTNK